MNDEEQVITSSPEQEQSEQTEQTQQSPVRKRESIGDSVDRVKGTIDDAGKVIETVGKGEEKVANWMDGGEKTVKAAAEVGDAAASAAAAGTDAVKKTAEAKEKIAETVEKTAGATKQAAQAGKTAAQAGKTASTAASVAADAERAGAQAAASIPYAGAAISAAGQTAAGIQKGAAETGKAASTAAEAAAATAEAGASAAEKGAQVAKAEAKAEKVGATAADAAAKTAKANAGTARRASDKTFAEKLRERGKLNQLRGKRLQDQSKKFDVDKYADDLSKKLGKGGKLLGDALKGIAKSFDPKTVAVVTTLLITVLSFIISYILSPMLYIDIIKGTLADPDRAEKVNNFISGLGFQNCEEAFYEELHYLDNRYGNQLDYAYIMSALYYIDIYYGNDDSEYIDDTNVEYVLSKSYLEETKTTLGEDGLVYSANKLYRLRNLAKNQFKGKTLKTVPLSEYIETTSEQMSNENKNLLKNLPLLLAYALAQSNIIPGSGPLFNAALMRQNQLEMVEDLTRLLNGTESWKSIQVYIDSGKYSPDLLIDLKNFTEVYLGAFFNIESVSFGISQENMGEAKYIDSEGNTYVSSGGLAKNIYVTYYADKFDMDAFEDYLVDSYIRYMPEFKTLRGDLKDEALDEKIMQIAKEIKLTREVFNELYNTDETAQEQGVCIGDINLDLLEELVPPIDLTKGQSITFDGKNNFGLYKGILHRGVDLEETSTGTVEGDNAYSIYDGTVYQSSLDGTYEDKNAKGGWLVIEYEIQFEDSTVGNSKLSSQYKNHKSKIRVYYGGLDPNSISLKQNNTVSKGEVIGQVGSAVFSENGEKASLHFGVYDVSNGIFLNPINMFITCNRKGKGTVAAACSGEGTTVEIPDGILEWPQKYTVELYGYGGFRVDGKWGIGYPARYVYEKWLDESFEFKNGIAIINIDGVDRYLAAVSEKFGQTGDLIFANLSDGKTSIPIIVSDTKDYCDTGISIAPSPSDCYGNSTIRNELVEYCSGEATDPGCYSHVYPSYLSVLEFSLDAEKWDEGIKNPASLEQEWDTDLQVVSITNCGSALD